MRRLEPRVRLLPGINKWAMREKLNLNQKAGIEFVDFRIVFDRVYFLTRSGDDGTGDKRGMS